MGKIYQQLSIEERTMIQTQLEMGIRPAAIAVGLNRSASTCDAPGLGAPSFVLTSLASIFTPLLHGRPTFTRQPASSAPCAVRPV
jgi:hypothetical protein